MQIVLFRHGPAGSRDPSQWPDDGERPLTAKGEVRTWRAARGLARLIRGKASILTSPLKRAADTAKLLGKALGNVEVESNDALAPGGSHRKLVEALARHGKSDVVILVGHEPDLGKLAGLWAFHNPATIPLKKAGACAVEFDGRVQAGMGRLAWLLPPRVLRRIGGKAARV
jgi:phosphohistidine phosphatase